MIDDDRIRTLVDGAVPVVAAPPTPGVGIANVQPDTGAPQDSSASVETNDTPSTISAPPTIDTGAGSVQLRLLPKPQPMVLSDGVVGQSSRKAY